MASGDCLSAWYHSEVARPIFDAETYALHNALSNYFGYHFVQLDGPLNNAWLNSSPIKHSVYLNNQRHIDCNFSSVIQADFNELPFAPNSVDVVLLPHTLEACASPLKLLDEVVQALIPEGYVIILGFNPISLWGLRHFILRDKYPSWLRQSYTQTGLRQRLIERDCVIDVCKTLTWYKPNLTIANNRRVETFMRSHWHLLGSLYMIVARKQVTALTPIRLHPRLVAIASESEQDLPAPTHRSSLE